MMILTDIVMSTNLQHQGHITNMECFIVEAPLECRNGVCVFVSECVCVCVCVCVCLFHLYALLNMQINASPGPGRTKRINV